jgi:hypothetical protein
MAAGKSFFVYQRSRFTLLYVFLVISQGILATIRLKTSSRDQTTALSSSPCNIVWGFSVSFTLWLDLAPREAEHSAGFLSGQKVKDGGALNAGLREFSLPNQES